MSKGSKRRPGKPGAYEEGWERVFGHKPNGPHQGHCDGCPNPASGPHPCPYREEIHGDSESLCTCCPDCTHQCAMDI